MTTWLVHEGHITQEEMDAVVRVLHKRRCSNFDAGQAYRAVSAGPVTERCRILHESQVCSVVAALEKSGFKVIRNEGSDA